MNKKYLLFLFSYSILIGMEENQEQKEPKSVSFSSEALSKLAATQEIIAAQAPNSPPPSIPRTKLSPGERYPVRPRLSPDKLNLPHRDSAPDIEGQTVDKVRNFQHIHGKD